MSCSFRFVALLTMGMMSAAASLKAQTLSTENFAAIHQLVWPGKTESRWLDIDWQTDLWQARKIAAAEGKPILLWSGGGALPLGGC